MQLLFILDSLFLACWVIAWLGLAAHLFRHSHFASVLSLIFGISGALLDMTENSLIWSLLTEWQAGVPAGYGWLLVWQTVRQLSYLLPFIGAAVACAGLWQGNRLEKIVAAVGLASIPAAVCGLYLEGLSILANVWFLFWFGMIGLLLWKQPRE